MTLKGFKKTRSDAWGEDLPEEIRWEIYGYTKPAREDDGDRPRLRSYEDAREHAAGRGIPPPSRAGWFRFLRRMRRDEHQLGLVNRVAGAGETAGDLVREARIDDATAAEAFKALSVNAAMDGDDKGAALYANAAAKYRDSAARSAELALRERAQATKDEQLKLAREKFEFDAAKAAMAKAAEIRTVAADDALDEDEKIARVREALFGRAAS